MSGSNTIMNNVRLLRNLNRNTVRTVTTKCPIKVIQAYRCQSSIHWRSGRRPSVKNVGYRFYATDFPSHIKVALPALSPTMESGTIINWTKKEGERLNEGDKLAEIETDKAIMDFETPEEGYLAKIMVPAGQKDVTVGKLVCIIVENESDVAAFKDFVDNTSAGAPAPAAPSPSPKPSTSAPAPPPPAPVAPKASAPTKSVPIPIGSRILASPLAKRLATEKGLDLSTIRQGSGLFGSIKSTDLDKASITSSQKTAVADGIRGDGFVDKPVTNVRKIIAKRLLESKQTIPHYYLTVDLGLDNIVSLRKRMNELLEKEGVKLSINDFIIKAAALACKKVPEANSSWMDNFIRQYDAVDVSVAVSTETGLITPIVFNADTKGLIAISTDVKELAAKARQGKLQPQEYQGGTFSVSNLGMFGVKSVSSIINPPQSCILGIGAMTQRLVPDKTNGTRAQDTLQVTLSCDHRVVDGAVGAQWLQAFRRYVEEPHNMLL
ncbi:dihydrolipoyllysine-residue acetyltransferase component of pyruvate dehydrogenase complex, mitochondrial [Acyrthosiphon pisum]|uniref:Acetyltransferase component of pyruvate dehydrogenase complex n=1 Tax=Acyrthosiphon pisum TaxID=7029 RepID=A0A8R1ZYZ6_ACYPI|nr:dihydrolipoyllysine-residue acetyltransferase component of pyruvate dehydrogenase complex, mitochondrial [Acyrthosiphon pisum]|eukprot:XP_001943838.2 PREDICTED: dihydrolipoyllysine-residue acetyltransferase component of pyruvate dehydrogenase complex, mitochondrial [Acyrthosiphon pisum]